MNAEVRQIKTAAEQGLAQAFADAKAKLPGAGAVARLREDAFREFEARGLPHRRVEEWKYTDLRALMREAKPLAPPADAAARALAKDAGQDLASARPRRIVLVDGVFAPDLSDLADLEQGLTIGSLAAALSKSDGATLKHLGKVVPGNDVAVALNTALMGDGVVIQVAANAAIARPLQIVFANASVQAVSVFTRSLVVVGAGASVTLIESHEGRNGVDSQFNHALELVIGDDAQVDHVKVAREGDRALHVGTLMASVGAKATFNDFSFNIGGAVLRNQLFLQLAGEGTNLVVAGATLLRGRQHADTTMVVDHAVGHCASRELFKSVLDGESRGVFQGKIIVRPHAQKTDGKMMTQALLLSDDAEASNKPELEIFADDVQCGHGATAGALNPDLLFYLRARGIPPKEAESLLVQAFVGEAMETIRNEAVRATLIEAVVGWLAARGA